MTAFAALIRGINVGGHKQLRMADLQQLCEGLGYADVRTLLQSGNVIFRTNKAASKIAKTIEDGIRESASMDVRVILRTADELAKVVAANPYPDAARQEPNRLIVMFLEREPSNEAKAALRAAYAGPEPMQFEGRELFIHYGEGMARSKLNNALIERKLGVAGTARNWNTVTRLLALLNA